MLQNEIRIPFVGLCRAIAGALTAHGVPVEMAEQEANVMVEADLQGVPSHGVRMLPGLLQALRDGRVKAVPNIKLIREFGATCFMDGDNGPGRFVACQAMDRAIERAGQFGVGVCLSIHTSHWGRAQAYAARAARAGMVGICTTNGMPCMAVWGAKGRVIGNNPLAIAIPRGEGEDPVVLDMAMSQAAVGKVGTCLREGRVIPTGWGIDAEGKPSSDAKAILGGAVLPFGEHKGAGLALMLELLTAALAGGAFGNEIEAGDRSGIDPDSCKLFLALNPAAFGGREVLADRVNDYLTYLGGVAAETGPFTWPGQRGWAARGVNIKAGVPLHAEIVDQLQAAGVVLVK
ncbi:MAG: Ldh family oxidoreductase [Proteobacteria bacterium]|nr:Ldh family oxidoreductase [Pseudomonadota bacterium]